MAPDEAVDPGRYDPVAVHAELSELCSEMSNWPAELVDRLVAETIKQRREFDVLSDASDFTNIPGALAFARTHKWMSIAQAYRLKEMLGADRYNELFDGVDPEHMHFTDMTIDVFGSIEKWAEHAVQTAKDV